jgi:hypothetical protein
MNRNILIGGIVAVVILVGAAAWILVGRMTGGSSSEPVNAENQGPITLNQVDVITDHGANESPDGRTLAITFPKFELNAKAGETRSAVFSTTWRMKLGADERALVAVATVDGNMKSAAPAPLPEPAVAAAPAAAPADAAAPATPPAAEQPAAPTPAPAAEAPPAPKLIAGNGVARVIVTIGTETTVSEWVDLTGEGAARKLSKAVSFVGAPSDVRSGNTIPVTVTVELSGGTSGDAAAKLNGVNLQLFAESAPLPQPAAEPATAAAPDAAVPATEPGATTAATPAETPASPAPATAAPTTPAPASGAPTP